MNVVQGGVVMALRPDGTVAVAIPYFTAEGVIFNVPFTGRATVDFLEDYSKNIESFNFC